MNPLGAVSTETFVGLTVAWGGGLLIGLDRERRKGRGPSRQAAGIRSFALVACTGAVAQSLQQPLLVALGAALARSITAWVAGGARYGLMITASLTASTAAAVALRWLT